MQKVKQQMSETMLCGSLLALAGGFLDVYTYLARGHVFANAQTGNIVLFGVSLARLDWLKAVQYLAPIAAFILGYLLTEATRYRFWGSVRLHWRQVTIVLETAVLGLVAFLPTGDYDLVANTAVSFVCSVQVQSFRKIHGNALATTMCTGNLRSGTEQLYTYWRTKERGALKKGLEYYCIIFFFIIGAVLGAWMTNLFGQYGVLFACLPLVIVFVLMFVRGPEGE